MPVFFACFLVRDFFLEVDVDTATWNLFVKKKYLLLTEFEVRTVSYGPSFYTVELWRKREALGP